MSGLSEQRLAEILARDATKGRAVVGVTMTQAEADRRALLAGLQDLARQLADRNDEYDTLRAEFDQFADVCASHSADRCVEQVAAEDLRAAYDRLGTVTQRITDSAAEFRAQRDLLHDTLTEALGAVPAGHERAESWLAVLSSVPRSEEP